MAEGSGGWVHLVLKEKVYANFGVAPVPIPIGSEVLLGFHRDGFQITTELMAQQIVADLEDRPDEFEIYRPLLVELALLRAMCGATRKRWGGKSHPTGLKRA